MKHRNEANNQGESAYEVPSDNAAVDRGQRRSWQEVLSREEPEMARRPKSRPLSPRARSLREAEQSTMSAVPPPTDPFGDLESAASAHQQAFDGGHLAAAPRRHLAILTCIDARIDPLAIFALEAGDAHIVRNAGARASEDALRSLIVSTIRMGVDRIAVVHHTQCGAAEISHLDMCDHVLARTGSDPAGVDFLFFADAPFALRCDVERIVACPYLPAGTSVAGFVYDVATGHLERATPTHVVRPHQTGPSYGRRDLLVS